MVWVFKIEQLSGLYLLPPERKCYAINTQRDFWLVISYLSFINLNVVFVSAKACRGMENVAKSTRIVSLACLLAKVWVT